MSSIPGGVSPIAHMCCSNVVMAHEVVKQGYQASDMRLRQLPGRKVRDFLSECIGNQAPAESIRHHVHGIKLVQAGEVS